MRIAEHCEGWRNLPNDKRRNAPSALMERMPPELLSLISEIVSPAAEVSNET
ncbi:MAG: hypothetical protein ACTS44_01370 [Candidatus Hodgkinia cicadicola]